MKKINLIRHILFFIFMIILCGISLALMYHAKFISPIYKEHFAHQCLWFTIGFLIIIITHFIDTNLFFKYSFWLYIINLLLLVLVLIMGENINGSKAWLNLKYFSFQPSEIMKLSLTLYVSQLVVKTSTSNFKDELLLLGKVLIIFLLPSILVFLEPDTGALIFYALICLICLYSSNIHKWWFVLLAFIFISGISLFFYAFFYQKDLLISLIGTTFFYRVERLFNFRSGMQIENALIAIGSAPLYKLSLTSVGIYIPESPTDFAFALTSNVFGIIGNIIILLCFLFMDSYLISYNKHLKKEKKVFAKTFLGIFLISQIINISMNLGLIPIIGIPLPFISYGGSSTITLFLFIGIIFSKKKSSKTLELSYHHT